METLELLFSGGRETEKANCVKNGNAARVTSQLTVENQQLYLPIATPANDLHFFQLQW
jgi:hypothetical protein